MPPPPNDPEAKVSKDALKHNRDFSTEDGKITGCHDMTLMMRKLKRELILVCVKNTPDCGFPEGVYSLWLTFEKTTGKQTNTSTALLDTGSSASAPGKKGKRKSRLIKGEIGSEREEPTDLQSKGKRKGRKEKTGSHKKSGKQRKACAKFPAVKEEAVGEKPDTKYHAAGEDTAKKVGIVCGDTGKEEGAVGGDTGKAQSAVGGDTGKAQSAVGGESEKEQGAVGGESEKEQGAVGGESEKEQGAVDGESEKEQGAVGGKSKKEQGAVGGESEKEQGAVGGESKKEQGAVGGESYKNTKQTRDKSTTYDLTLLSEFGINNWEVKLKTVFKPILKTVYDPRNWPDDELKKRCQEAFTNALCKGRYKNVSEGKDAKNSRIYWEGRFKSDKDKTECFWIAGFSDRLKKSQPPKEIKFQDLKDYEVNNFYFIHDSDRIIKEE